MRTPPARTKVKITIQWENTSRIALKAYGQQQNSHNHAGTHQTSLKEILHVRNRWDDPLLPSVLLLPYPRIHQEMISPENPRSINSGTLPIWSICAWVKKRQSTSDGATAHDPMGITTSFALSEPTVHHNIEAIRSQQVAGAGNGVFTAMMNDVWFCHYLIGMKPLFLLFHWGASVVI